MSAKVSPIAANACGLACTRTAGRWPPLMVTKPTPATCEMRVASRVSARSCNWVSGIEGDDTAMLITGVSAGFTLLYTGGLGKSVGSRLPAALIAACTSCSATSSSKSKSNCRVITDEPPDEREVICSKPDIWPNWRSSGAVTEEVTTSGLAPG